MGSKSKCTGKGFNHKKAQKAPKIFLCLLCLFVATVAQTPAPQSYVLRPARVFDGESAQLHDGWVVVVRGEKIEAAGPISTVRIPAGARSIDLPGLTLMPGLIDAHSHVLLHPYSETSWNDQVAHEALALRIARATNHLRSTLRAGFTTIRDLGTEGAGYADVGLRDAVAQGIIPGPRMLVVTRAIVATGSYAPKGYAAEWRVPQGAEEADGVDSLIRVVRDQIGKGADWIKVYADYGWGPNGEPEPTIVGIHFDPVSAFSDLVADDADQAVHTVGFFSTLRDTPFRSVTFRSVAPGCDNRACDDKHARPGNNALRHRVSQTDVGIPGAFGSQIANCCESSPERTAKVIRCARDPQRQSLVSDLIVPRRLAVGMQQHVRVGIDEARHQRQSRQIDRARAGRNPYSTIRTGGFDLFAAYDNHPAVVQLSGFS